MKNLKIGGGVCVGKRGWVCMKRVGVCAECGGVVYLKWRDKYNRWTECAKCGVVNPKLSYDVDINELAHVTRFVFEALCRKFGVSELTTRMFAAVEYVYGKPLHAKFWELRGLDVLHKAGLTVNGRGNIVRGDEQ